MTESAGSARSGGGATGPSAASPTPTGPAELVRLATVARRFYLDGASKVEIADETGLSRFKVARLLDRARATGVVRVEISLPSAVDAELSEALRAAYGLRHAVVVDTPDEPAEYARRSVGEVAAALLAEHVTEQDVLGVAWGRSLNAMAASLTHLAPCPVVQLCGSLARPDAEESSLELVRRIAQVGGGRAYPFYAPLIVPDPTTADALRRQPELASARGRYRDLTTAVVSVGAWAAGASTVYDALDPAERQELADLGVCAEVSAIFLDADGTPVETDVTARALGITSAELRSVPEVVAVAYGPGKVDAVRAVLTGGLVSALVTTSATARALLDAAG